MLRGQNDEALPETTPLAWNESLQGALANKITSEGGFAGTLQLEVIMKAYTFAGLLLVPLCGSFARAELIGVGLDFRKGIFVQEYWQDGKPYYAIANLGKEKTTISVADWKTGAVLAGPWDLMAQTVRHVDASTVRGDALVRFQLADGSALGLLMPPTPPPNPVKGSLATYDGMNGSGGRQVELWCEQAVPAFKTGEIIELALKLPTGAGVIKYTTKPENGNVVQLPLLEASCETLPVKNVGNEYQILASKPLKAEKLHTVTLRFRAPTVAAPTMVMLSGWRMLSNGGGHGITRGVVVMPAAKAD